MIGFLVGTVCLVALVKLARARRRWYGCARGHHGFGHRRRPGVSMFLRGVDASPEQEKVILDAWREVDQARNALRGEWSLSRKDLARAFAEDSFDAVAMGHAFARHDEVIEQLRKTFVGAAAKIHDTLEPRQRQRVIDWLGGDWFSGGQGPYRGASL